MLCIELNNMSLSTKGEPQKRRSAPSGYRQRRNAKIKIQQLLLTNKKNHTDKISSQQLDSGLWTGNAYILAHL